MTRGHDRKARPVCEILEGRQVLSLAAPSLAAGVPVIWGSSHNHAARDIRVIQHDNLGAPPNIIPGFTLRPGGLGGATALAHTATPAPNVDVTLQVGEHDDLVDTHIDLQAGDRVVFYADGKIWAGWWFLGENGPRGMGIANESFPDPAAHAYSLLGVVDGNQFFEIGYGFDKVYTGSNGTSNDKSRLFLVINDNWHGNGNGAFNVHILVYKHYQEVQPDGQVFHSVPVYRRPGGH